MDIFGNTLRGMVLKIISSGSVGNCYLLDAGDEVLIVECGVPFKQIKRALCFDISKIVGAIVSHRHMDHAKSIKDIMSAGIPVLSSEDVFSSQGVSSDYFRAKVLVPERGYKIGNFKIIAFEVLHDCYCLGFHIHHPMSGNILFVTDTYAIPYRFSNLNQLMIEINYSDEIIESNIINDRINPVMRPRLLFSHMELETAKGILRSLDLSNVVNIVLLHLSSANSNEKQFVDEISEEFCKNTIAASKEIDIDFNLTPY